MRESFRRVGDVNKLSEHLRKIDNKTQVALTGLQEDTYKFSLADNSHIVSSDHEASLRQGFVHVRASSQKCHDLPERGSRHARLSEFKSYLECD